MVEGPRWVALLRGINVGGHRVRMAELRHIFEELVGSEVETYIASGNVMFTMDAEEDALTSSIEARLRARLGYEVPTILRTATELNGVVRGGDLPDQGTGSTHVVFLREPASRKVRTALAALESDADRFDVTGREIYWRLAGRLSESPLFGPGIDRVLQGVPHTMRGSPTVVRLAERLRRASTG